MMKKRVFIFLTVLLIGLCCFFTVTDNARGAEINLEGSTIYSEAELRSAANIVLRRFRLFPAKLERLWYDEERSIKEQEYFSKQYDADEVIVLMSDFTTRDGESALNSGFEPGMRYANWMWILVRNEGRRWQLKTYGY